MERSARLGRAVWTISGCTLDAYCEAGSPSAPSHSPTDTGLRPAHAIANNVLDWDFSAAEPNRNWFADVTYVWNFEAWLYVAAVMGLYSRRIVGWSMQSPMTSQLLTGHYHPLSLSVEFKPYFRHQALGKVSIMDPGIHPPGEFIAELCIYMVE